MENKKSQGSISLIKRNLSLFLMALCPTVCSAAAGFVDRWNDFLFWMRPALVFCLFTGCVAFSMLLVIYFIFRKPITALADRIVSYLRKHNVACVIIIGILWTVFLNFATVGLNLTLWIVAFLPVLALLLAFPVFLATRLRNKYLVGRVRILLLISFFISTAVSILAFVYEVDCGMISEPTVLMSSSRAFVEGRLLQYPQDCLYYMLEWSVFFGAEVILSVILVFLGNIYRKLNNFMMIRKLSMMHSEPDLTD